MFIANRLILLVPAALAGLWLGGQPQRGLVLKTLTGIGVALFISYLCGALWPHPRPFTIGLGHAFFTQGHLLLPQQPHHHHRHAGLHAAVRPALGGLGLGHAGAGGRGRPVARLPGVHLLDIAGGLLAPLAAALVMPVCGAWAPRDRGVPALHGKLLALPIARGWIRARGAGTIRDRSSRRPQAGAKPAAPSCSSSQRLRCKPPP